MAPEQVRGNVLDQRVDVFATGIVLYELVTGQHPFVRATDEATLRAIEAGRYLPAEMVRRDCPPELSAVIDRAMASRVAARCASAADLAEAIQHVYPLDSRHAAELGSLVRSLRAGDLSASASGAMQAATVTLTKPG